MTRLRISALLVVAGLVLSSCSLFSSEEAADVPSEQTLFDNISPAAQGPAAQGPAAPVADAVATQTETLAQLEDLYRLYGIEGSPRFDGGVWFLDGIAPDEASRSHFVGAAQLVAGVNVTSDLVVFAAPVDSTTGDDSTGAPQDAAAPAAGDDAATSVPQDAAAPAEADDALARTGLSFNLALVATLLIVAGMAAVSTGRHIWLRTQFTNCFRVVTSTTTFTVQSGQRPRFETDRRRGRGPRHR